jgi:hypothetical protein
MTNATETTSKTICLCACCRNPITKAQAKDKDIADHKVYKCGELSYIELAHKYCAKKDTEMPKGYWEWD